MCRIRLLFVIDFTSATRKSSDIIGYVQMYIRTCTYFANSFYIAVQLNLPETDVFGIANTTVVKKDSLHGDFCMSHS